MSQDQQTFPLSEEIRQYGFSLQAGQKAERAYEVTKHALGLDPTNIDTLGQLGIICIILKKYKEAEGYLLEARAKRGKPDHRIEYSLGRLAYETDNYDKALAQAMIAHKIDPEATDPLILAAMMHGIKGNVWEQLLYHELASKKDPTNTELRVWCGMDAMLIGQFDAGLNNYEARLAHANPMPQSGKPIWNGEDLAGKSIVVHLEQGVGDCIQFARFFRVLKDEYHATQVVVACHIPYLKSLLPYIDGVDVVYDAHTESANNQDYQVAIMSLLRIIPQDKWYPDHADNGYMYKFPSSISNIVHEKKADNKIGICWRGNPRHSNDKRRSLKLEEMLECIPSNTWYEFFNLQHNPTNEELADLVIAGVGKSGVENPKCDIMEQVLRASTLGKVITCDTAVAHMAGSLGVPTIMLLPVGADWRWGTSGSKTPWYRNMTIIRAEKPLIWDDATKKVREMLKKQPVWMYPFTGFKSKSQGAFGGNLVNRG